MSIKMESEFSKEDACFVTDALNKYFNNEVTYLDNDFNGQKLINTKNINSGYEFDIKNYFLLEDILNDNNDKYNKKLISTCMKYNFLKKNNYESIIAISASGIIMSILMFLGVRKENISEEFLMGFGAFILTTPFVANKIKEFISDKKLDDLKEEKEILNNILKLIETQKLQFEDGKEYLSLLKKKYGYKK